MFGIGREQKKTKKKHLFTFRFFLLISFNALKEAANFVYKVGVSGRNILIFPKRNILVFPNVKL